jgi:hypothetical protein
MNDYQKEQWDALIQIKHHLNCLGTETLDALRTSITPYIQFRKELDIFLDRYFSKHCTESCFQSSLSACCSKDGIITFWADMVINACMCNSIEMDRLLNAVRHPAKPGKCIYLCSDGCCWQVRPLVCAMFLCDSVRQAVFSLNPEAAARWCEFEQSAKSFRWPDRPVLFDQIEQQFMDFGCRSSLMYLNTSPGLLRVKRQSGMIKPD